jgi:cytochrome d ubiquinol oxidase subunit II
VTGGGALFAAFPHAYATAFSGFYLAFMLLLCMLIFRAVSIEFRSKEPMAWWRKMWDWAFSISSIVASVLFGVAIGNLVVGLPIGADMEYTGGFFNLLTPYTVTIGVFALSLFMMHGALYLHMKTEGSLQARARSWFWRTFFFFLAMYAIATVFTLVHRPQMIANFRDFWWAWGFVILNVLAIANIPRAMHKGLPFRAFVSSCCTIAALFFLFGIGVFPNLIVSSLSEAYNLTVYNSASSEKTLRIMLIIAVLGMPCVIAYTVAIYYIFRGKTKLDQYSY